MRYNLDYYNNDGAPCGYSIQADTDEEAIAKAKEYARRFVCLNKTLCRPNFDGTITRIL